MTFPAAPIDVTVEIAFDGSTWVDVTGWLLSESSGLAMTRNRGVSGGSAPPGRASCTLSTRGVGGVLPPGTWDPTDPTGAYWQPGGWLGCQLRVLVEGEAWFQGSLTSISPSWGVDGVGQTAVVASGALQRVTSSTALADPLPRQLARTDLLAWWPLDDPAGSDVAASGLVGGGPAMAVVTGSPTFGAGGGPAGHPGAGVVVWDDISSDPFGVVLTGEVDASASAPTAWTVSCWFRVDPTDAVTPGSRLLTWATTGTSQYWTLGSYTAGLDYVEATAAPTIADDLTPVTGQALVHDAGWHVVQVHAATSGSDVDVELWVDDSMVGSETLVGETLGVPTSVTAGEPLDPALIFASLGVCTIADVTVTVGALPTFARDPGLAWVGETAADRFARLCAEEGVTAAVTADDTATMGPQLARPLLALLRECEAADQGRITEAVGGALVFRSVRDRYNRSADWTLDTGWLTTVPAGKYEIGDLLSRVDAKSEAGLTATALDDAVDGVAVQLQANVDTARLLRQAASWVLHLGGPDMAYSRVLEIDLARDGGAAVADWLLAVFSGDPYKIRLPAMAGLPLGLDGYIEGWTETINTKRWSISLVVSPARRYEVVERGASGNRCRRDATHATLAAAVSSSATTLSVATGAGGALWTTGSGLTLALDVEGERVTCTAIAGSSSPQSFTVTRAANGVVKAHGVGAQVRLWEAGVRPY